MAEAIRKCTSLPADRFRLKGRGRVQEGACADLVLFDEAAVEDRATYAKPHAFAAGIRQVWVDGAVAWKDGAPGERNGRYLEGN